ncbi:polycomb group RING finger protein 6-like [Amphiura filiformis]|uniref:polycomb group RING finger protein 6-like n=1 Tax=Amphiura filiformis TaxID=82378 RepID=UPI003B215965
MWHHRNTRRKQKKIDQEGGQIYVRLTDINQYITCHLCGGYFVDATTITECLHTFCKGCLVQYLYTNENCPTCDKQVHPSNPFFDYAIRPDRTIQDIVNKLLPYIESDEREKERIFYQSRKLPMPQPVSEQVSSVPSSVSSSDLAAPSVPNNIVPLQLDFAGASEDCPDIPPLKKKFLCVPDKTTIQHVQKFLIKKLQLTDMYEVDIVFADDIMEPELTLKTVYEQATERELRDDGLLRLQYSLAQTQLDDT